MVVNIVGLLVFGAISSAVKSSTGNELQLSTIFPEFTSPLYLAIYVLSVAIFAPIFEELLLRGTLLTHTLKYGQWFSFLAVGISFGLLHGNFQQMFYTATLGIMLCFITFKAKSIIPAIVTHVFINAPTAIATFCMSKMNMEEYAGLAEQVTELQKKGEKVPAELNSEMVDWIGKNLIQLLVVMLIILFMITIFIIGIVNFVGKMRDRREFKCGNCCMVLSGRQKFLAYISGVFTIIFVGVCVFLSVLKAIG
jgi:membrane protease YdiL (CAAX protease family)